MHLLLVKFHSGLSHDEVVRNLEERLPLFRAVPGLVQKYYAREQSTGDYVGVYSVRIGTSSRELPKLGGRSQYPHRLSTRGNTAGRNHGTALPIASRNHAGAIVSRSAPKQEVRFCTARDGARIAYAITGSGPPLVKAANWLSHLEYDLESPIWRHWFEELSRDHRLIRYDERGCGLSDWDAAENDFETWVTDLEAVVDATGVDQFALLGISQGGPVAVEYAVRHPHKVTSLILYGTYARGWKMRGHSASELAEREAMITLTEAGWGRDIPVYRDVFTKTFMPDANEEQRQWFNELQRKTCSPANAVALQRALGPIDVSALLPRVQVPTLVLHARGDLRCPLDEARRLAAGIPGSRFVLLEGQNHILLEQEPAWEVFLREVRTFLGVDPTPSPKIKKAGKRPIRERRVVQWGLAYLTAAWILLQVLGELQVPWNLPTWILRVALIVLLVGFIPTVIFAWVFGKRADR